jgi:hypothetical protein
MVAADEGAGRPDGRKCVGSVRAVLVVEISSGAHSYDRSERKREKGAEPMPNRATARGVDGKIRARSAEEGLNENGHGRPVAGPSEDEPATERKESSMSAKGIRAWIGIGLLGLPLYGALTFWSSMHPQPDPQTRMAAWSRYVTTDHYVISHVFGSTLGLILAIFGTFALGAYLAGARAGRLGLVAMVVTVFGTALFLPGMGVSTFSAPREGQAYLAGIEEFDRLPTIFADGVFMITALLVIVLLFVGNVLLGVAVWRSGTLPKLAGVLWAAGAVFMYPLGIVYAVVILGVQSTPPTVLVGAALLVLSGAWMAYSALRRPSSVGTVGAAQPRVQ